MLKNEAIFPQAILFYDGNCGLCSRAVRWILRNEKNKLLSFASLSSPFSSEFFRDKKINLNDTNTVYLCIEGVLFSESDVALRLLPYLKWYWRSLYVGYLVPKFFRNTIYRLIARNRQRLGIALCDLGSADSTRFMHSERGL